jgi:hypothetical protein
MDHLSPSPVTVSFSLHGSTWELQCDHNGKITVRRDGDELQQSLVYTRGMQQLHYKDGTVPRYYPVTVLNHGLTEKVVTKPYSSADPDEQIHATINRHDLYSIFRAKGVVTDEAHMRKLAEAISASTFTTHNAEQANIRNYIHELMEPPQYDKKKRILQIQCISLTDSGTAPNSWTRVSIYSFEIHFADDAAAAHRA